MRRHRRYSELAIPKSGGFTLVELLVVITIIAILVALLLPAVQAAREAARQMQCRNNLRQLAQGCITHENVLGHYPTNGWGSSWTGDADRGTDWRQPGGWFYNILPYIEQQAMHDLGAGLPTAEKYAAHYQRMTVPLSMFYCPSRRKALAYPWVAGNGAALINSTTPSKAARSDYAGNGGSSYTFCGYHPTNPNPVPGELGWWGQGPPNMYPLAENPPGVRTQAMTAALTNVSAIATGIFFFGSTVRVRDVTDGTSCTFLAGEKYLNPDSYDRGDDPSDNEDAMMGDNADIARYSCANYHPELMSTQDPNEICTWGYSIPLYQDIPGAAATSKGFGSSHSNGCYMAYCDGRVELINYRTDFMVEMFLSCRNDGRVIDAKAF